MVSHLVASAVIESDFVLFVSVVVVYMSVNADTYMYILIVILDINASMTHTVCGTERGVLHNSLSSVGLQLTAVR